MRVCSRRSTSSTVLHASPGKMQAAQVSKTKPIALAELQVRDREYQESRRSRHRDRGPRRGRARPRADGRVRRRHVLQFEMPEARRSGCSRPSSSCDRA
jgi:hypothetical protein